PSGIGSLTPRRRAPKAYIVSVKEVIPILDDRVCEWGDSVTISGFGLELSQQACMNMSKRLAKTDEIEQTIFRPTKSFFDDVECFPGGSVCDVVPIRPVPLPFYPSPSSSSSASSSFTSSVTAKDPPHRHHGRHPSFARLNSSSLFNINAFGRNLRFILHARDTASVHHDLVLESPARNTCFQSGFLLDDSLPLEEDEWPDILPESEVVVNRCVQDHNAMPDVRLGGQYHMIYQSKPPPSREYSYEEELDSQIDLNNQRARRSSVNFEPTPQPWTLTSKKNWVEVLVVADGPMVQYHGANVESYIHTLMDMVSLIYRHESLGNSIHISLVQLILLDRTESFAPQVQGERISASEMLKIFCNKWQRSLNRYSKIDYDVALLITRENLCRNTKSTGQSCDTLGLAEMGTMCGNHSCAIVQDNGLSAAFTIAHELGHVLNMPHDDDKKCSEFNASNVSYVMSRMLHHNTNPWEWSTCSREYVTKFLDLNYGHCLQNEPHRNLLKRDVAKLPGEYYDENKQCEFVFGHGSTKCSFMPQCSRLWCATAEGEHKGCRTQHMPWADGTGCGEGHWCLKNQCVPKSLDDKKVEHGEWSDWQPWTKCSRTCGGGIKKSIRQCTNPSPKNGGSYCVGMRVKYVSCNTMDCPRDTKDFRLEQCEQFNGRNLNIEGVPKDVEWVPKYTSISGSDQCKLFCRIEHSSAYHLLSSSVIDGTPCGTDTFHTCVDGQCIPAGCDRVLNSNKVQDWCGVCGGDNSTCQEERGNYNSTRYGYNTVVRIPPGATRIKILQHGYLNKSDDDTYISLRDVETNKSVLNGDFVMSLFRKTIQYEGTALEYSGSRRVIEHVKSVSPLKKGLIVEVLMVGNLNPPQIDYSYVISRKEPSYFYEDRYPPKWSKCDRICKGKRTAPSKVCIRSYQGRTEEVANQYCSHLPTPEVLVENCNDCHLEWSLENRDSCSSKCGAGKQTLRYGCVKVMSDARDTRETVEDQLCISLIGKKPPEEFDCEGPCEGVKWNFGLWSECTKTCGGGGYQFRSAHCVDKDGKVLLDDECFGLGAITKQACGQETCPDVTCGSGVRQRPYWCEVEGKKIEGRYCSGQSVPRHYAGCEKKCLKWFQGNWTECSTTCGEGVRTREIFCQDIQRDRKVDDRHCGNHRRPNHEESCNQICSSFKSNRAFTRKENEVLKNPNRKKKRSNYVWRVGAWQNCTQDCQQKRQVVCFDQDHDVKMSDFKCKSEGLPKPLTKKSCQDFDCRVGRWLVGSWSNCSDSCGQGSQRRHVRCVSRKSDSSNQSIDKKYCPDPVPDDERVCSSGLPCFHEVPQSSHVEYFQENGLSNEPQWRHGEWSECTQTCGSGVQRRIVVCQMSNHSNSCDLDKKPLEELICNTQPCPRWNFQEWNSCDVPCGQGHRHRLVRCQNHLGEALPDFNCELAKRPLSSEECSAGRNCQTPRKPKYRWKQSPWSICSKACDGGYSRRTVQCVDISNGGKVVNGQFCALSHGNAIRTRRVRRRGFRPNRKPKTKKKCNKLPCPFKWVSDMWSECSHTCGKGAQHRRVTCHRVNAYGWIDPEEVSHGCNATAMPVTHQDCVLTSCNARYMWQVEPWGSCFWKNKKCGRRGRQRRKINCVDKYGQKTRKKYCKRHLASKPKKSRRCEKKICGFKSCLDRKLKTGNDTDGEYEILFAGENVKVYCHDMNTPRPKEYITLPTGGRGNYAEIYWFRLNTPDHCPYNGARNDSCDCVNAANEREGLTSFQKIRVNVTSLKVNAHDFTFATQLRGQPVPYGEAGDCYSTDNCPQGQFGIDLTDTPFVVAHYIGWAQQGNQPSLWLKKESDNQVIHGKCGGYCGWCKPDPLNGLKLDLRPPISFKMTEVADASVQTLSSIDVAQDDVDAIKFSPLVVQLVTTKPKKDDPPSCTSSGTIVAPPGTQVPSHQRAIRRVMPAIEEDCYNTKHEERGLCLILEHDEFRPQLNMSNRKGSEMDLKALTSLFNRMGFNVNVQRNLPYGEISKLLARVAAMDHSKSDCFAMAVLSHGSEGIMYAFDAAYPTQKLWEPFTADKAPTLAGKPKLLFLQACQGSMMDEGIKVTKATPDIQYDSFASYKMPVHTDFLIAHSTITGYYSWRNTVQGSWFIQSLIKVMDHCRDHRDLLSMLTLTHKLVSSEYESSSSYSHLSEKKQTPFLYSTLTYKLYLDPKKIDQEHGIGNDGHNTGNNAENGQYGRGVIAVQNDSAGIDWWINPI
ncbi:hypothetical protein TCAL_01321, partial [Tigriopus californicus]